MFSSLNKIEIGEFLFGQKNRSGSAELVKKATVICIPTTKNPLGRGKHVGVYIVYTLYTSIMFVYSARLSAVIKAPPNIDIEIMLSSLPFIIIIQPLHCISKMKSIQCSRALLKNA